MTPIKLTQAKGRHRTVIVRHPLLDASATDFPRERPQADPSYLRLALALASREEATGRSR